MTFWSISSSYNTFPRCLINVQTPLHSVSPQNKPVVKRGDPSSSHRVACVKSGRTSTPQLASTALRLNRVARRPLRLGDTPRPGSLALCSRWPHFLRSVASRLALVGESVCVCTVQRVTSLSEFRPIPALCATCTVQARGKCLQHVGQTDPGEAGSPKNRISPV